MYTAFVLIILMNTSLSIKKTHKNNKHKNKYKRKLMVNKYLTISLLYHNLLVDKS